MILRCWITAWDVGRAKDRPPAWAMGFVGNRTTIIRHLMRRWLLPDRSAPRAVGLDEWASRKGLRFGNIAVDLERRPIALCARMRPLREVEYHQM